MFIYLISFFLQTSYNVFYKFSGATPRLSPAFQVAVADKKIEDKVKIFRNIFDFEEVQDLFDSSKSVAIVGGGFLGSELACAMARKGMPT